MDRLSIRTRPPGRPLMHQTWGKLLFMHWPIRVEELRPRIPARLEIDTFDGKAWIGVTPFTMWGVRPIYAPAIPLVSSSHELNVRTYVHLDGIPGVWFFSLDAANPLAVIGARLGFSLPYFQAFMTLRDENDRIEFTSHRMHVGAPDAHLEASWLRGAPLPEADPGTLDFFLTERYSLYAARGGRLYRSRIFHPPWPLRKASLSSLRSTMIQSHGFSKPRESPLLHAQGDPLHVDIWPLKRV